MAHQIDENTMKFTLSWLEEYLDLSDLKFTSSNELLKKLGETLNRIGLEVDDIQDKSAELADFNCVMVEECIAHPNSDRLHLCQVRTANDREPITIVCGAPNVRTGLKTILAPIKSKLPNGTEIKKSKIRGIDSNGMLCSEKELGVGEDADGIIEIDASVPIGTNVVDALNLGDPLIEISLTPNRGDCLGVYGIARDLACADFGKLRELENIKLPETFKSRFSLSVGDPNCPLFSFREIRNVRNCESPDWLKNKLKSIGVNPKNALVDITNYVMYSLNKPLHCYDAARIRGGLRVEASDGGEHFRDLFDRKYILPKGATIIKDEEKILCLGGIIGSKDSCSEMNTSNVLVESAIFDAINTAKNAKLLNIETDSKYRFERGSDYEMVDRALDYACKLIVEICGGEISQRSRYELDDYKKSIARMIELDLNYMNGLLGLEVAEKDVLHILNNFGYGIEKKSNKLALSVPLYKNNILCAADVVDDIIRIYGYEKFEERDFTDGKIFEKTDNLKNRKIEEKLHKIRRQLVANAMTEVVSYSFLDKKDNNYFCNSNDELDLINPIISNLAHLRENMMPNLLNIMRKNVNRGYVDNSFFEIGNVYNKCAIDSENTVVCGLRSGSYRKKDAYNEARDFDIYDVKKDLFDILDVFAIDGQKLLVTRDTPFYYHPKRSGALFMGKVLLGYFGELNPKVARDFGVQRPVGFEFFVDNLPPKLILEDDRGGNFQISDLPTVQRDLAFIVDESVEVGTLLRDLTAVDRELIVNVALFDIYRENMNTNVNLANPNSMAGPMAYRKSVAVTITLQSKTRTLTGEEIDTLINKIVDFVGKKYGGILRDR